MSQQLDKVGQEAARILQGMDGQRKLAQPLVERIFAAFEEAKKNKVEIGINGAKGKTQWAEEFAKVSLRYCQQIRRDGTRKNEDTNRGSRPKTANLDTADFIIFGGQRFKAREFAEAIDVALMAGGSKRERTERTLSLRERLCEASDAWETAHGADFTNEHLREHAREEEAKAEAKKQAKKPKVHYVPNLDSHHFRTLCGKEPAEADVNKGGDTDRVTCGLCRNRLGLGPVVPDYKVHMAGENGKVLCSDRKDAALRRTSTDEEADHLQGLPL